MSDKWTLYYCSTGERATKNSWPTEDWAEYMAKQHNYHFPYPQREVYVEKV